MAIERVVSFLCDEVLHAAVRLVMPPHLPNFTAEAPTLNRLPATVDGGR